MQLDNDVDWINCSVCFLNVKELNAHEESIFIADRCSHILCKKCIKSKFCAKCKVETSVQPMKISDIKYLVTFEK